MAQGAGILTEIRLESDGLGGRITCPAGLRPAPGQYLAASGPDPYEPLSAILYPTGEAGIEVCIAPPLPPGWTVGMQLSLRGPLGSGFRLPVSARRVALAGLEGSAARLLPLAYQALAQQSAVTIFSDFTPAGLPPDMEVLPLDLLAEAPAWADFLALDVLPSTLPTIRSTLGLKSFSYPPCIVQVLIRTSMPCTGLGECGVCAVPTHAGWKLVCSDGPVFDFNALELGG